MLFTLKKISVKTGTVLIETVLRGDPLYKMYYFKCHAHNGLHFFFFIFKEITTSVVSFNRQDRLRLIGFDSSFDPNIIGQCINQHYQSASIQPQNYCGATEFKLKGYPFHCSGMEAIKTRRLIVKVLVSINKNNN